MTSRNLVKQVCRYGLAPRNFAAFFIYFISVYSHAVSETSPTIEYQVKASLVFNFLHFIEWPPDVFQEENTELSICLAGPDFYGRAIAILNGEVVQGKTMVVKTYATADQIDFNRACQVVIFSSKDRNLVASALSELAGKSVLTIGDTPGFLKQGGIIKFEIVNETVQFDINHDASKKSRLLISSKLLRLARNVVTSK